MEGRGERGKRKWGDDSPPSSSLVSFLSALPNVPATGRNVRWLLVRTSRQGPAAGWTQAGDWQQKEQTDTLCEAAEDSPC